MATPGSFLLHFFSKKWRPSKRFLMPLFYEKAAVLKVLFAPKARTKSAFRFALRAKKPRGAAPLPRSPFEKGDSENFPERRRLWN